MDENKPVQEPDLEGVEMRLPDQEHEAMPQGNSTRSNNQLAIILLLTLIMVALLGGLFIWFTNMMEQRSAPTPVIDASRPTAEENNEPESTTAEAQAESLTIMSTSDELSAIEADLESTNVAELDAELNAIEAELDAGATTE